MMIIVHICARSGMFKWMANEMLKLTKGKPKLVLFALALFTAIVKVHFWITLQQLSLLCQLHLLPAKA